MFELYSDPYLYRPFLLYRTSSPLKAMTNLRNLPPTMHEVGLELGWQYYFRWLLRADRLRRAK